MTSGAGLDICICICPEERLFYACVFFVGEEGYNGEQKHNINISSTVEARTAHTKTGGWDCTVCLTGEATASCLIFNVSMHGSMSRLHTAINSAFVGMQNICTGATGTVSSDFSVHTFVNETFLEIKKQKTESNLSSKNCLDILVWQITPSKWV